MTSRAQGLFVAPGDGAALTNPIGGQMIAKLRDAETNGAYSLFDNVIPAGSPGPRAHRHVRHEETFYVIDGELTVELESQTITAPAGSVVFIPRGAAHRPSNRTEKPVHVLLIFSPSGMDEFFAEAAELRVPLQAIPTDPETVDRLEAFTARYGYEFADADTR